MHFAESSQRLLARLRNIGHLTVTSHRRPRPIVRLSGMGQLRATFAGRPQRAGSRPGAADRAAPGFRAGRFRYRPDTGSHTRERRRTERPHRPGPCPAPVGAEYVRHDGRPVASAAPSPVYGGRRSWFAGRSTRSPGRSPRRRSPYEAGERESGGNPELSRSGERERPPSRALGTQPGKRRPVGRPIGRSPRVRRPAGCTGYAVSGGHRLEDWASRSTSTENTHPSAVDGSGSSGVRVPRVRRWPSNISTGETP